ncbi:MAG TPA: N-acetyltransferase [Aggregatilineaceae bacterium]|nr:N-acetyltransferase [Aggregatilineaceae bacterium]
MTVLTIRQVTSEDADQLALFLEENNRSEITRYFHPFPLTRETALSIAATAHLDRYYVAIQNDQIVGMFMLRGWDEGYSIPSFGVFVDYRCHQKGFGRQLTEFAIEEARRLGCPSIRLSVYASNHRAVHLYESLSFEEVEREQVMLAGQPDTRIVMLKGIQ